MPENVEFFGAHYKIDVIEQVANEMSSHETMLLLDCDVVALAELPADLINRASSAGLGAYDVSEFVLSSLGATKAVSDLETIAGIALPNARWFGGEFLLGQREALRELVDIARDCYERYISILDTVCHQGDEAYISAALNIMSLQKGQVCEVGAWRAIVRHWSGIPFRSMEWAEACAFIHVPGNKRLLEASSARDDHFDVKTFMSRLRRRHGLARLKWALLASRYGSWAVQRMGSRARSAG